MWYGCQKLAAACLIGKVKKKCREKVEKNLTLDIQIGHYKPFGMSPTLCQSLLTFLLWVFFFFLPPLAFLAPLPRKGWTFFKSAPLWCQKGHSGTTDILLVPLPQRSWDKLLGGGVFCFFLTDLGKTALSDVTKGLATFPKLTTSPTRSFFCFKGWRNEKPSIA